MRLDSKNWDEKRVVGRVTHLNPHVGLLAKTVGQLIVPSVAMISWEGSYTFHAPIEALISFSFLGLN